MPESDIERPSLRTKIYGVLLAALVGIGSIVLVAITHEPKSAVSSPGPPKAVVVPEMAGTKSDAEIDFRGKSFCPIKRKIGLPFSGEILNLSVEDGQTAKEGEVLCTYKLDREAVMHVHRVLFPEAILNLKKTLTDQQSELDKLTNTQLPIRQSEEDRLEKEAANLRELRSRNMASPEAVLNKERDLEAVRRQVAETQETIKQLKFSTNKTRQDLAYHEDRQKREVDLLEYQTRRSYPEDTKVREAMDSLKGRVHPDEIAFLKAPIDGQVIWISPDLVERAELHKGFEAITVGAPTPVVVRCKVHELDLVRLRSGDRGSVTFDAIPTKRYVCKVTKIPSVSRNPSLDVPADYEVECKIENPDEGMKDGLTCNVKIHVAQ